MIPYGKHKIDSIDIKSVERSLKSQFITQGPLVKKFEKDLRNKVKSKYSIVVNSATSALHISCLALEINKSKIVWTVPNTFVSSANAALFCGAKIDFVDIDERTFNISLKLLQKKLEKSKKEKKLPSLLIIVHLGGNPTLSKEISKLSKTYKFKIIEDASHSLGASYYGKKVGCSSWSDITVFSFHPVKMITAAEGGAAMTNNKKIYKKLSLFSNHGITKNKKEFIFKNKKPNYYEQQVLGFNYRMNELQAALGISQLKKLDKFFKERNLIANYYKKKLIHPQLNFQEIDKNCLCSYHLFIIKITGKNKKKIRNEILFSLKRKKIYVGIHYHPVHLHPYYKKMGFSIGNYPKSEEYSNTAMSLPIYPGLKTNNLNIVIKNVLKILNDK
tara:strand:+ start:3261 stop:4424 length:1164 start_codon:yes stop_codon:yes gene_type:complete